MKHSEVQIGGLYLTRVSGELVEVRVASETTYSTMGRRGAKCRIKRAFRVTRDGSSLPKIRTAAALRPRAVDSRTDRPRSWVAEHVELTTKIHMSRASGDFDRADMLTELRRGLQAARGHGARYRLAESRLIREGVAS